MEPRITDQDCKYIYTVLTEKEKAKLKRSKILITGYAGSLGYTLLNFFAKYAESLEVEKVYGIDNYMFGKPDWIMDFMGNPIFDLRELDITECNLDFAHDADFIFHMASLASPVFYRLHPLETIDADIIGIRRLLEFYKNKPIKGLLFYSSSEVYGEPHIDNIPTQETYWGNVNTVGPRSCYDESKRFGETLCFTFAKLYNMPVTVVRPFNNYGPGMRINDQRVVADFAKSIIEDKDIVIFSDGTPRRTFDYIPDATVGYLKCIVYGQFDVFNIGSDGPEISILQLAKLYQKIGKALFGYTRDITFQKHSDGEYLTDNPTRRCPNISKSRELLGFNPSIDIEDGIARYLKFLKEI